MSNISSGISFKREGESQQEPSPQIAQDSNPPYILVPSARPQIVRLLNLPTEIKTAIIGMLLRQDLNYKARTTSNASLRSPNFGRSLNACFEVNKELSELAAVHIFDVSCNLIAR